MGSSPAVYIPAASHLLTLPFQLLALILTILNCLFTLYGTGRHITVQEPQWVTPSLKVSYCVRLIYVLVLGTTKIAVLTLYRRVFDDKKTRNIIWSMMGAVALYSTPVLLMYLFQCRPIYGVWESSIQKTCINTDTVVYIAAGCSIALDIALVIVAVPRIRKSYFACQIFSYSTHQEHNQSAIAYPKEQLTANNSTVPLKLPRTQKAALIAIASLSILVIISAVIRLVRVTALASSIDYTCMSSSSSLSVSVLPSHSTPHYKH
jgi:hypothetical protein